MDVQREAEQALFGLYDWDSAYAACRQQRAHLPSIHDDVENLAFSEVAQDYPMVILGLRNNAVAPWSDKPVFTYEWADGSFFHYSQLPEPDDDTPHDFKCAYFETGQTDEKPQWVLMNCRKPASMATAVCQRSPKDM
ncbi:hypothetical protein AAVH_13886 [Aphelenchoides avenae]|nr:hypothetical protein AAVH_13886 [Aphelenchus avenae]